ncbi:hypothetical protein MTO96_009277 [Rhipicephalus appendiculatus]
MMPQVPSPSGSMYPMQMPSPVQSIIMHHPPPPPDAVPFVHSLSNTCPYHAIAVTIDYSERDGTSSCATASCDSNATAAAASSTQPHNIATNAATDDATANNAITDDVAHDVADDDGTADDGANDGTPDDGLQLGESVLQARALRRLEVR